MDLCVVDANEKIISFSKSNGTFSYHHFLISVTLELFVPSATRSDFSYRNFNKIDANSFSSDLELLDWNLVIGLNDVNIMLKSIETYILKTLNTHAPEIKITSKRKF